MNEPLRGSFTLQATHCGHTSMNFEQNKNSFLNYDIEFLLGIVVRLSIIVNVPFSYIIQVTSLNPKILLIDIKLLAIRWRLYDGLFA